MGKAIWKYQINGQEHGPIDTKQLQHLAKTGKLKPTDLIWREGLKEWVPASKAKGLFPTGESPSAVSPPPAPTPPLPGVPPAPLQAATATEAERPVVPSPGEARPSLPTSDEDQRYWRFIEKLDEPKKWFTKLTEMLIPDVNGPLPRSPKAIVNECQRLASHPRFGVSLLGMAPADVKQVRMRYRTCLMSLEKWAAHYPEYRGDFLNLWNETVSTLKVSPASHTHFSSPEVVAKYGLPVPTHPTSTETKQQASYASAPPPASPLPTAEPPTFEIGKVENSGDTSKQPESPAEQPLAQTSTFFQNLNPEQQNVARGCIGCLGIVVVAVIIGLAVTFIGGDPGASAVEAEAEAYLSTMKMLYGDRGTSGSIVTLYGVKPTKHKGGVIPNEHVAIYYVKAPTNAFGTNRRICVNVFYRYDPDTKKVEKISQREVNDTWE